MMIYVYIIKTTTMYFNYKRKRGNIGQEGILRTSLLFINY